MDLSGEVRRNVQARAKQVGSPKAGLDVRLADVDLQNLGA